MQDNNKNEQEKPTESTFDKLFGSFESLIDFFRTAWHRAQNLEKTNMELGLRFMKENNYFDAALRFKYACWKNPHNMIAQYMQGKAYTYAGRPTKALEPLRRALKDKPDFEEAKFLLACCGEKIKVERVPPSLLIEHLDSIADLYEEEIAQKKNMHVNNALYAEFEKIYEDKQGYDVLDLSCRTGDAAETILSRANYIVGVDASLKMISKSRDKRKNDRLVYNQLVSKLPTDFLKENERQFDIILCTFSFMNYGDLSEHFSLISKAMKKDAVFAFNIVKAGGEAYIFDAPKISFKHSQNYINELAKQNGLELLAATDIKYNSSNEEALYFLRKA